MPSPCSQLGSSPSLNLPQDCNDQYDACRSACDGQTDCLNDCNRDLLWCVVQGKK